MMQYLKYSKTLARTQFFRQLKQSNYAMFSKAKVFLRKLHEGKTKTQILHVAAADHYSQAKPLNLTKTKKQLKSQQHKQNKIDTAETIMCRQMHRDTVELDTYE